MLTEYIIYSKNAKIGVMLATIKRGNFVNAN